MSYNFKLINSDNSGNVDSEVFSETALGLFHYQYANNAIYRSFVDALHIDTGKVTTISKIPFLPISFFKTHRVVSVAADHFPLIFESSGTTGDIPSRHFVYSEEVYEKSLLQGFEKFYGAPQDYAILALLPSYLERSSASLVHMADVLMKKSGHADCGFYLNEFDKLAEVLVRLEKQQQRCILLGVTFALLDFSDSFPMHFKHTIVMETGGMKGRRKEWTRGAVHEHLKAQWGVDNIHSEYGMTELLSQAYSVKDGIFQPSPTMQVLVRDMHDPLDVTKSGTGCLNIIDTANIYSCAFIATDDIGTVYKDGSFEVLGRADHSALRGCNLMVL